VQAAGLACFLVAAPTLQTLTSASAEKSIQDNIQIEQDRHQPYFSIRCSSIHRLTVSSSGLGWSILSNTRA
jgi:hypothetical protein